MKTEHLSWHSNLVQGCEHNLFLVVWSFDLNCWIELKPVYKSILTIQLAYRWKPICKLSGSSAAAGLSSLQQVSFPQGRKCCVQEHPEVWEINSQPASGEYSMSIYTVECGREDTSLWHNAVHRDGHTAMTVRLELLAYHVRANDHFDVRNVSLWNSTDKHTWEIATGQQCKFQLDVVGSWCTCIFVAHAFDASGAHCCIWGS